MHSFDVEFTPQDVQSISSPDAVAAFFAKLGYDTAARTNQTAANLAIPDAAARPIKRIELIADHKKLLQVYLFELTSVTVAEIKALARAFRNRAGQFLLVLTSDYEFIEFILLDRELSEPKGPTAISTTRQRLCIAASVLTAAAQQLFTCACFGASPGQKPAAFARTGLPQLRRFGSG